MVVFKPTLGNKQKDIRVLLIYLKIDNFDFIH